MKSARLEAIVKCIVTAGQCGNGSCECIITSCDLGNGPCVDIVTPSPLCLVTPCHLGNGSCVFFITASYLGNKFIRVYYYCWSFRHC